MSYGNVKVNGKWLRPVVDCQAANDGRTKQSDGKDVDINTIIKRYTKTGLLDSVREDPAIYADVSQFGDYRSMVDKITLAKNLFMGLPSDIRTRFSNDPALFVSFMGDEKNRDEAVKLGLLPKPKDEPVPPVVKVPEPAPEPKAP